MIHERSRTSPRKRSKLRLLSVGAVVGIVLSALLTPAAANAYSLWGCKWGTKTINMSVAAPLLSYPVWTAAISTWAGNDAKFVVNQAGTVRLSGTNENRGNTVTWSGIMRKPGTVATVPVCPASNIWADGSMQVVLNYGYLASYSSDNQRMVAAHELGHAYGLAHSSPANVLMHPYDSSRTVIYPTSDDKAGVNVLY